VTARALLALLGGLALLPSGEVAAQSRFGWGVAGGLALPSVQREVDASVDKLSGTTVGGWAHVRYAFVEIGGHYLQGSIDNGAGGSTQDLVEGSAFVHFRPVRQAFVGFGPRARSFVEGGATERWLTWEARAGIDAWLFSELLRSSLEVSLAFGGSVSGGNSVGSGAGVEGGIDLHIPRTPLFIGVTYRLDQVAIDGVDRKDTVEQFRFRVGVGP